MGELDSFDGLSTGECDGRYNLALIRSQGSLLVGRKTRGFGKGQLVLPGGKDQYYLYALSGGLLPGPHNAAREVEEETGLVVPLPAFQRVGDLDVLTLDDEKHIDLFMASVEKPTIPASSDELAELAWLAENTLPYDQMPKDYKVWLPFVLSGYAVTAFIEVDEHGASYGSVIAYAQDMSGKSIVMSTGQG